MAQTLVVTATANLSSLLTNALDLSTPRDLLDLSFSLASLTTGVGANAGNQVFHDTRTLASAATENIDMYDYAGALDGLGVALTMARVKVLIIHNKSTTASDVLTVGGEGSAAAWNSPFNASDTAKMTIRGGAHFILTAPDATGYAVVDVSNHLFKIVNDGAGSVTYDIVVIGANA